MEGICWKGFWRVSVRWFRKLEIVLEGNLIETMKNTTDNRTVVFFIQVSNDKKHVIIMKKLGDRQMGKKEIGYCHICGCYGELSYEHIPPENALNTNKAIIYTGDDVIKRYKGEKSKYICRQQGMGKFSLCENCNNKTGSWYVPQYSDVAKNVARSLHKREKLEHGDILGFSVNNFPALAFIKQVITMFCSLLPIEEVKRLGFDKLLLEKDNNEVDTTLFDLRIYLTPANVGQLMIGPCAVLYKTDTGFETMIVSDLGVYPFGFILNLTPEHPIEYGASIMSLFETEYGKGYKMQWGLMYLERTSDTLPMPLQFKSLSEDCK